MLISMTGFASGRGASEGYTWDWELRSVNGKGLDLRLRVPDWIEGLETALRARLGKALARGNVTVNLRVQSEQRAARMQVNEAQLDDVLEAIARIEGEAMARGISLAPSRPGDILAQRGVLEMASSEADTGAVQAALLTDFEAVLDGFLDMRRGEGRALEEILAGQLDEISRLTSEAAEAAQSRREDVAQSLRDALARVLENSEGADPDRIAQELALLAVKSDVTEELDRLHAHVTTARDMIATGSPIGRKLDFLAQEFNREANTLCSKAQSGALTKIGLELKTVIDQMREQVQNVE